jgi:hypothetical protein
MSVWSVCKGCCAAPTRLADAAVVYLPLPQHLHGFAPDDDQSEGTDNVFVSIHLIEEYKVLSLIGNGSAGPAKAYGRRRRAARANVRIRLTSSLAHRKSNRTLRPSPVLTGCDAGDRIKLFGSPLRHNLAARRPAHLRPRMPTRWSARLSRGRTSFDQQTADTPNSVASVAVSARLG